MNFEYKGEIIEFQIIRRKRKSICIKIDINGEVQVVAPMRTSKEHILNFLIQNMTGLLKRGES